MFCVFYDEGSTEQTGYLAATSVVTTQRPQAVRCTLQSKTRQYCVSRRRPVVIKGKRLAPEDLFPQTWTHGGASFDGFEDKRLTSSRSLTVLWVESNRVTSNFRPHLSKLGTTPKPKPVYMECRTVLTPHYMHALRALVKTVAGNIISSQATK